jgi:hypothetical protein
VRVAFRVILYKDILILETVGFFSPDFAHLTVYNLNVVGIVEQLDFSKKFGDWDNFILLRLNFAMWAR